MSESTLRPGAVRSGAPEGKQVAAGPSRPADPPPVVRRWWMLPVLLAALFMAQFDLYVVNVAAPTLQHDLGAGEAALQLIVAGYGFSYAAGLITAGRLGDLFGSRWMFIAGTAAFVLASLLCGLAQSPGQLVVFRLFQGLGGAAMVPQVLALITRTFPPVERPRALAWFGVTIGLGAVAGQVAGGALLEVDVAGLGWRVIFLVNVPIGILAALLAYVLIPRRPATGRARLDLPGALGLAGTLALVLVPLVLGRIPHWPAWTWAALAASLPVLALTLWWERRLRDGGGQPVLDLALLQNATFGRGMVVSVCVFASFFSFMFTVTLVLQSGLGLTPLEAGITFTPLGIAFALASILSPRLVGRYGARLVTTGTVVAAVGLVATWSVLVLAGPDTSVGELVGPMTLIGFGNGLAVPALTGAVLAGVLPAQAGAAAGVLTTSQQFASAAGVAALGAVFFQALGAGTGVGPYAHAHAVVVGLDVALILVAAATTLLLPAPSQRRAAASQPAGAPTGEQSGAAASAPSARGGSTTT